MSTNPIPAFEKSTHNWVSRAVSNGRSPRGPLSSFLNSSNSCCCSCCHKKMASLDRSLRIFSNEFDILGKKLRKELAMPRKERTSLTLVGGGRSMIAWHFSFAGLYPFSPPRVKPASSLSLQTGLFSWRFLYCIFYTSPTVFRTS